MSVLDVFAECNKAVVGGAPIKRANRSDKEFHFQNWFVQTLTGLSLNYDLPRRNTYPDFRLVASAVGFELKGLEFPAAGPTSTATARCAQAFTTVARSTTCSGDTRKAGKRPILYSIW